MRNRENDISGSQSEQSLLRFLATFPDARYGVMGRWSADDDGDMETCPEAEMYLLVAKGDLEPIRAEELLTHAATCSLCGDVLARSVQSMEGNPSPEEAAAIAQLIATSPFWQRNLARELAASTARRRPGLAVRGIQRLKAINRRDWFALGAVAAGLLMAAGIFLWERQARDPEHELAMAYTQSRTLELRVPEAGFAPLTVGAHTRGALADREPAQLLEARARLARELERSPQDAHWLELKARADVLEERYDAAIEALDRLVAQGPITPDLLLDAATAYYQRGLVSGSELDRSTSLDYMRRADELAPTDPVVLFNEAIVMEDRGQMMNAVEVWNRFITVERDQKWAAEGKRKLAALEQTLNRLKSHQSRIDRILASPAAMDALADDPNRLAAMDEELSSYELDKLLPVAYPAVSGAEGPVSLNSHVARGSPCPESCIAARKLLKAIGNSLDSQHHDPWLTDLTSVDFDALPRQAANSYAAAVGQLAAGIREDTAGDPNKGEQLAFNAGKLFDQLPAQATSSLVTIRAAQSGAARAAVEAMFAKQIQADYRGCREFAQQLSRKSGYTRAIDRYPSIHAMKLITDKVCDDTPETRGVGDRHLSEAANLVEVNRYPLLHSRIQMRLADAAYAAGDEETAERIILADMRELAAKDPPPIRIMYAVSGMSYAERDSPRTYMLELALREDQNWFKLVGSSRDAFEVRMDLAEAEVRIGNLKEAENQIRRLKVEDRESHAEKLTGANLTESDIFMANAFLERSDLTRAGAYLDEAGSRLSSYSDTWALRTYAASRGQLELARGQLDAASATLEPAIRRREGASALGISTVALAEFAQKDHDLYAELAATWLGQGRAPESVLALWERFRLRSRGLSIRKCQGNALDCEQPGLTSARGTLGKSLLTGEILLMDRVLVYRVDKDGVTWSQNSLRLQSLLDSALTLERAVASPLTSLETATELGRKLNPVLLPSLPSQLDPDSALLLEPDPLLQNLPWPVLPTASGPLGLQYPLAEVRSILAPASSASQVDDASATNGEHALLVGASLAGSGQSPLPEAMKEAQSVSRFLHSPEVLLGDRATTTSVADALGSATIFHFAGHAMQTGNGTELLLAASSQGEKTPWIDGTFLRQHSPRMCRLAVLSACSTGTHESSWVHPLQDMVETLGDLGVPEVVATRWQIDSEASVSFIDSFYQSLAQGSTVAMALTSARRVESRQSLYKNPYYWGAYYVTGREKIRLTGELHARVQQSQSAKEE